MIPPRDYIRHFFRNLKLAYPIILGQLSHILISVADNTMVGNYDSNSLAASSLAHGIYISIMVFGVGFSLGITSLTANARSARKLEECRKLLKHGLLMYPILGILLTIILFFCSYHLDLINDKYIIVKLAEPYLRVLSFSLIPIMIFQCFRQFMEGLSMTKIPMYVNIGGLLLNILLNYIFIFGVFGASEMGLEGAAYATLLTRIIMTIALMLLFMLNSRSKKYLLFSGYAFDCLHVHKLYRLGFPVAIQMFFEAGAFSFATLLVGELGVDELAAHQIALNVGSVTFLITTGLSVAASIRTASEIGKRDRHNLYIAGQSAILMAVLFMAVSAVFIYLARNIIPTWYVQDSIIHALTSKLLLLVALFQVSDGVQVVAIGVLRGMEDVRTPTIISLISYWLVGIPLGYVLCFKMNWGMKGVWCGLWCGLSIAAVLLYLRVLVISKRVVNSIRSSKVGV